MPLDPTLIGQVLGSHALLAGPNGEAPSGLAVTNPLWLAPGF